MEVLSLTFILNGGFCCKFAVSSRMDMWNFLEDDLVQKEFILIRLVK